MLPEGFRVGHWSDHAGGTGCTVVLAPAGAIVYDLPRGDPKARPGPDAGRAACDAAGTEVERGTVGAGTGAAVGKDFGPAGWTKGGVGLATDEVMGARVTALAVVNAVGEVVAEDGSVLAGAWRDGAYVRTADALKEGAELPPAARESTTLVCLMTDAKLTKREVWLVARAASAGVGRAVQPSATAWDGDLVYALASGAVDAHPFAISTL